jgi:hypothetical protein
MYSLSLEVAEGLASAWTFFCSEPPPELLHPPAAIAKTMPNIKTANFIS